jgi:tetratricopeptide (TPR) repeat protein
MAVEANRSGRPNAIVNLRKMLMSIDLLTSRRHLVRRSLFLLSIVVLLAIALPVFAQETPVDPSSYTPEELEALVERVEAAADRAETALAEMDEIGQRADDSVSYAYDLFGFFEVMSAIMGIGVPLLAVIAGFLGFNRLRSAESELKETREKFGQELQARQAEFDALRDQLRASAQEQRDSAVNTSLAQALLPLGERQYRAQDFAGALDTYRRALELDPDNPSIHYRLGYVYTHSGELDLAKKHLARSLEVDDKFTPSRAALGYVYRRQGDKLPMGIERDTVYNQAEDNFLKALNVSPKLVDEDGESWWGSLGGLYRRRGQTEQAIHAYENCATVTPQSSYPFSNLALLYATTHNRRRMIETYVRVEKLAYREVQAEVDNYWAYADLVVARLAQGKIREAETILDTTLGLAPADSSYMLEMLLDTLARLLAALEANERGPVQQVMERIRAYYDQQQQQ